MANPEFLKTKSQFKIDIEVECQQCGGTGLYVGMAERNGAAVVCQHCDGTGKERVLRIYKVFNGRKKRKDVERVYETAAGYGITAKDYTTDEGEFIPFSEYGCSYEDWLKGATPRPIEALHCPYQHTNQNMQLRTHPAYRLYTERCDKKGMLGIVITACNRRGDMAECWRRYHELVSKKGKKK